MGLFHYGKDISEGSSLVAQMVKNPLQCRRLGFGPWVTWRREWLRTPVFLPRESHGWRSLVGYSPRGHKRVGHNLVTKRFNNNNNNLTDWRMLRSERTLAAQPFLPLTEFEVSARGENPL